MCYQNIKCYCLIVIVINCQKVKQIPTPLMTVDVAEIKEVNIVKICNESSPLGDISFYQQICSMGHNRVLSFSVKRDANRYAFYGEHLLCRSRLLHH